MMVKMKKNSIASKREKENIGLTWIKYDLCNLIFSSYNGHYNCKLISL